MSRFFYKFLLGFATLIIVSNALAQIPSTFFGTHEHRLLDQNEPWPVGPSSAHTIGTIRTWDMETLTGWMEIEHSRGSYDFTNLDKLISEARTNGVDVLYTFGWTPQWAIGSAPCINSNGGYTGSPSPGCAMAPASMTYWTEFVTALVQHVASVRGSVGITYELWNEPDSCTGSCSTTSTGLFWNGPTCSSSSCPSIAAQADMADLVTMAQDARTIIAANDPGAKLTTPSPALGNSPSGGVYVDPYHWLLDFFNAGGGTYVDVVAFHGYPGTGKDPAKIVTFSNEITNSVSKTLPQWDTESSQCNSTTNSAFVGQFELLHVFSSVVRHYWYAWDDGSCGPLWSSGGGLNAGGIAYANVYSWIVGSTKTSSSCSLSGTVYNCGLTESNGKTAAAVWNTAGTSSLTITAGVWLDYRDLTGATTSISPNATTVAIGVEPILLETAANGSANRPTPPSGLTATVQ